MRHLRPLHLLLLLTLPLWVGCEQKAASITIEPIPGPILSFDPIPLPAVVVLDAEGQPLKKQPELVYSMLPPGLLQVSGDKLLPLGNGNSLLTVQVKDQELSASVAVEIHALQSIELKCAGNPTCAYVPGEEIRIDFRMLSAGTALEGVEASWKSQDEGVVKVLGPGKLKSVGPGDAEVRVDGPNHVSATLAIHVVQPTRIAVSCVDSPGCTVPVYQSLNLKAEVFGAAYSLPKVAVQWRSSDEEVARVDAAGKVEALKEGSVVLTATGGGVSADQTLLVGAPTIRRVIVAQGGDSPSGGSSGGGSPSAGGLCGDMKIEVRVPYQFEEKGIARPINSAITGTCSSGGGLDCAKRQLDSVQVSTRAELAGALSRISASCCCSLRAF